MQKSAKTMHSSSRTNPEAYSVVIPTHNSRDRIAACLMALQRSDTPPREVIVVDDGSTDGTGELVRTRFPQVRVITHATNRGPVAARNTGARETRAEYILFLDDDMIVPPDAVSSLLSFIEKTPDAALISPEIRPQGAAGRMWWSVGYEPSITRGIMEGLFMLVIRQFPSCAILKRLARPFTLNFVHFTHPVSVDWVSEGVNLVRRDLFEQIGGFDERFFMFFEGPDLCRRIRDAGWCVYLFPRVTVPMCDHHTHLPRDRKKWFAKSRWYYFRKHAC